MTLPKYRWAATTAILLSAAAPLRADVRLPAFFNHDMVLQRDKPAPVWGWANPGEEITVTFAGQTVTTRAAADGKWKAALAPLAASAEGRELTVRGANAIVLKNVVVGDVWICAGQSNMAERWGGSNEERQKAGFPLIRQVWFHAPWSKTRRAETECDSWRPCGPETVGGFSAVGYFFAHELHQELGVPIGLIVMAAGGNRIEPWIAPEAFQAVPELKEIAGLVEHVDI